MVRHCRDCKHAERPRIMDAGKPWAAEMFWCQQWGYSVYGDDTCRFHEPKPKAESDA